jgi:hypothetical protein
MRNGSAYVHLSSATFKIKSREAPRESASALSVSKVSDIAATVACLSVV